MWGTGHWCSVSDGSDGFHRFSCAMQAFLAERALTFMEVDLKIPRRTSLPVLQTLPVFEEDVQELDPQAACDRIEEMEITKSNLPRCVARDVLMRLGVSHLDANAITGTVAETVDFDTPAWAEFVSMDTHNPPVYGKNFTECIRYFRNMVVSDTNTKFLHGARVVWHSSEPDIKKGEWIGDFTATQQGGWYTTGQEIIADLYNNKEHMVFKTTLQDILESPFKTLNLFTMTENERKVVINWLKECGEFTAEHEQALLAEDGHTQNYLLTCIFARRCNYKSGSYPPPLGYDIIHGPYLFQKLHIRPRHAACRSGLYPVGEYDQTAFLTQASVEWLFKRGFDSVLRP